MNTFRIIEEPYRSRAEILTLGPSFQLPKLEACVRDFFSLIIGTSINK